MSCLFNSLSALLKDEMHRHSMHDLRAEVIQYIERNPNEQIDGVKISEWIDMIKMTERNDDYLHHMRSKSAWGGAPEIAVIALMFGVRIVVMFMAKRIATFEPNCSITATLYIQWSGGHYTAMRRVNH